MKLEWYNSESTVQPVLVEKTPYNVFLRRNIRQEVREEVVYYKYEEVVLSHDQYETYEDLMQSPQTQQIMAQISDIQSEQAMASETSSALMKLASDIQSIVEMLEINAEV